MKAHWTNCGAGGAGYESCFAGGRTWDENFRGIPD